MKNYLVFISALLLIFLFSAKEASAVDCPSWQETAEVSSSCSFADSVDGADAGTGSTNTGTINVSSGATLTISASQTVATGSLTITNGNVVIISGGQVKSGTPLWVVDSDGDGYPDSTTQYAQTSAPTNGIRRNAASSETDCDSGTYSETNTCCTEYTWYQDSDGDGYGNPSVSQVNCNQPAGYVLDNTDCYDSNANAKPGQTTCYTTNRGDGSFDYDCNGSGSNCNTCSTSASSATYTYRQCDAGYCYTDPYDETFTGWTCSGSTSTCGASGKTCGGGSKPSGCTYSPCSLYDNKDLSSSNCTVSCR